MLNGNTLERKESIESLLRSNHGVKMPASKVVALTIAGLNPLVFGLPGGASLPLEQMAEEVHVLRYVLVKHEAHAAHAAGAYGAVTGFPAFSMVTSGPAAYNSLTGVYDNSMEFYPAVHIAGDVALEDIGDLRKRPFQGSRVVEAASVSTKRAIMPTSPDKVQSALRDAWLEASNYPMGPVFVNLPKKGVTTAETVFEYFPQPQIQRNYQSVDQKVLHEFYAALKSAKRPIVVVGRGAFGARQELWELIERMGLPFVYTLKGKGVMPDDHPQNYGLVGMHGKRAVNDALKEADLVIFAGANGDDRAFPNGEKFTNGKKALINTFTTNAQARINFDYVMNSDAQYTLVELLKIADGERQHEKLRDWNVSIRERYDKEQPYNKRTRLLSPVDLMKAFNSYINPDILVLDVGENQMHGAKLIGLNLGIYDRTQLYAVTPKQLREMFDKMVLTSGTAGTMATAIPYAAAAKIASPDKKVVAVIGDGGVEMHVGATWMLANPENDLDVGVLVVNNQSYGQVYEWLNAFHDGRVRHSKTSAVRKGPYGQKIIPDFRGVAVMYNLPFKRVSGEASLERAIKWFADTKGPRILEARVSNLGAYPMMPPGGTPSDTIYKPRNS